MKFILFVEGSTEKQGAVKLIRRWLDKKLEPKRVGVRPINLKGAGNFAREIPRKAPLHLEGSDRHKVIAVIGLLDLHGANIVPGTSSNPEDLCRQGKSKIEKAVNHDKFRMFFAVHDVEAWILSQPEILPTPVAADLRGIASPEKIDLETPPAKMLERLFLKHTKTSYRKVVDGEKLFDELDPEVAYQKCPHLRLMLDEMLELAKRAGL